MGLSLVASSLFAVDYSAMSITELQTVKGTIPVAEQPAFKAAM